MIIGVAGPYSADTPEQRQKNLDALNEAAAGLLEKGHTPLIGVNAALPVADRTSVTNKYESIMKISLAIIDKCEALLLIGESPGANRERDLVLSKGLKVYYDLKVVPLARPDEDQDFCANSIEIENYNGIEEVNGLKMYHEIHGKGFPLVLIHGGGSNIHTTFGRVIDLLACSNKVIAVEMQAHGRTADIDRPLSFEQDSDDISKLLELLKIEKANIFGFSNGGSTALQFAIRHPAQTNRIVVASTFSKRTGAPEIFWEMIHNASFENMPVVYKHSFLEINNDQTALHRMYERDVARMQTFRDIPDEHMKSVKAPALIISGDRDVTTIEHLAEMKNLLEDSRLAVFPGGHGEYIGEIMSPKDEHLIRATVHIVNSFLHS